MQILISLPLAALIALAGRRALKRHPGLCYAAAALVALAAAWGTWTGAWSRLPVWGSHGLVPVFTRGALAMALFYIVMFANAVPNGAAFMRAVMPIRGELSILASILAVGHGAAQLKDPLEKLLAGALPGGGTAVQLALSLAALLVMLPLFATSFKRVRRRMEPGRWKRLQRLAYGFYALVFAHVLSYNLLRAVRGVPGAQVNTVVYGALFLLYAAMRAGKALEKRCPSARAWLASAACCGMLALVCLSTVPAWGDLRYAASGEAADMQAELEALRGDVARLAGELEALRSQGAGETAPTGAPGAEAASGSSYADGKYSGAGIGYNGRLTVSVVVENGAIASVKLTGSVDDEEYLDMATEGVIPAVLAAQGTDVDAVTGATTTSEAILAAVDAALEKAAGAAAG